jgi:hypothetical protein
MNPTSHALTSARVVPSSTLALMGPPSSDTEREGRIAAADEPLNPRAIKGAFWGGVIASAFGGAMTVGFGAAGSVASNKLADEFDAGITRADQESMASRGETYNALAVTGASLLVTGLAVAAITYAVDATRCGPLRQKRETCTPK